MNSLIYDAENECWLRFSKPIEIIQADRLDEVVQSLQRIEERVRLNNLYAAGFISYEASPAFDSALQVSEHTDFPLLSFGLFETVDRVSLDLSDTSHFTLSKWVPSVDRNEYDTAIAKIKSHIRAGDTYQVNYSFRMLSRFSGKPIELFRQLSDAQHSSHGAFIETEDYAICSASPELFFSLKGDDIVVRPMKGTARRGLTLLQDKRQQAFLHRSEKNRSENLMIVDMMRNDLGRIAETGTVSVPSLFNIERYPTVLQMTSSVSAKTNASISQIMSALFPCASITGAPKASTMKIIAGLESSPRKIYTGTIGFIAPNRRAQFNVAIRTVLIDKKNGTAEYGVGGGIVWGSTADDEYTECITKARVLTDARPQFSLFETILFTPADGFFLLEEHLSRIKNSAEYFDFSYRESDARRELDSIRQSATEPLRVKLVIANDGTCSTHAIPFDIETSSQKVLVRLSDSPIDSQNLFLYHKTTHRKVYDQAQSAAHECDDVILWNEREEITESTIANVVAEFDGVLVTPPIECGLLGGVFRQQLLRDGKIGERIITKSEFLNAHRVFLINSLRKWREVEILN
jgi:para-aminobenzoate synthetase / 4-amino-4-deoxychorismate lyase